MGRLLARLRALAGRLNRMVDFPKPPSGRYAPPDSVWFGCIYRAANASIVEELLGPVRGERWDVHLWALDETVDRLADATSGMGEGGKFGLLQRMLDENPPSPSSWIVLSDDDYVFERGNLKDLVALADAASLDLCQPAHSRFVNASHHITLVRPRIVARRTHFVEIGPVVVVAPRARSHVLPFPQVQMGWGLELLWSKASLDGLLRLGIVDAVTIHHLAPPGSAYDIAAAMREQAGFKSVTGISYDDARVNLERWRRLQSEPPWRGQASRL